MNNEKYLVRGSRLEGWRATDRKERNKLLVSMKVVERGIALRQQTPPTPHSVTTKPRTKAEYQAAREQFGLADPWKAFPIRSRADLEEALQFLDTIETEAADQLAHGKIGPLRMWQFGQKLDEGRRRLKNKLVMVTLRISEAERERKNSIEVRESDGGGVERKAAGEWVPSSESEVARLAVQQNKEIKVRRFQR